MASTPFVAPPRLFPNQRLSCAIPFSFSTPLIPCKLNPKPITLSCKNRYNQRSSFSRICASMADQVSTQTLNPKNVQIFDNGEDLSVALAKYTADLSQKCVGKRGTFSVVFSGGSLFNSLKKLVEPPYVDSVDWAKWHVFWLDERVVLKDHADSNYKLAYDNFLSKVPIPPGQVYAINDTLSAEGAADDYEACLKHLVEAKVLDLSTTTGFPRFDLLLVGMGPDGHVASLFPGHHLLSENQRWVTFIKDSPKPPPERITFTCPVINSASNIAMVITGSSKAEPVRRALGGDDENTDLLPVQMVAPKEGETTWFLDKGAASKL
ncbi:hypothetical protein Sjap_004324 [Stephania japonica]|uniref:Probable 6-phosphogluconolactonase n=1 Tax=Stephania japonica TaxID=461633 RepID=A0AAP0K228_9MAGN